MRKLRAEGRQPDRSLAVQLGMKTFFGLPPEFKGKIISCLPNIVCALPPGFATLAPRQAVRLINLAGTSQEEKYIYFKTPRISIKKHVKTAC